MPFSEWKNAAEVPGVCTRKIHVKAICSLCIGELIQFNACYAELNRAKHKQIKQSIAKVTWDSATEDQFL